MDERSRENRWEVDRREAMVAWAAALATWNTGEFASAQPSSSAPSPFRELPNDRRLGELRDLDGYFPFEPPQTPEEWSRRADEVRRRILVAAGLWPMPPRPPIEATRHGAVERDDFVVEKVYFESSPGLFVTGNLYRPKQIEGKLPGVLCPHGHWHEGRFHQHDDKRMLEELARGAEKFAKSGRFPQQCRCVQLARMGCVVLHYDMLGYADNVPMSMALIHGFSLQRPSMSQPDRWGLYSAQSEMRSVNSLGLQTFNSIRALDWLSSLEFVDADRLAVTGSSGGGTQTMLLSAVDTRVKAAFPAVMVSTSMQGGCTCENASYLRIDTGNVEFAALTAPRPLGLTAANDWTRELETKGLPELRQLYAMLDAPDHVEGKYFDHRHNFNLPAREMLYRFLNQHFELGFEDPIEERDFEPLSREELSVWNAEHPKPAEGAEAELKLLRGWDAASQAALAIDPTPAQLERYREIVGGALEVMVGRSLPPAGAVEHRVTHDADHGDYREFVGRLRYAEMGEELPTVILLPRDWQGGVAIGVHEDGKRGLFEPSGTVSAPIRRFLDAGVAVLGLDLLYQGDFLDEGMKLPAARTVKNPRQFAGYTLGYNPPLFAQRVHDVLTAIAFARFHPQRTGPIYLLGFEKAAPWVLAATAHARGSVDRVAVLNNGWRFASITKIRDPYLWPGSVKFGDIPALVALSAPTPLWIAGETEESLGSAPAWTAAAGSPSTSKILARGTADNAIQWLLRKET